MGEIEGGLDREIEALDAGSAFVQRPGATVVLVGGDDARGWLNDLLTVDIAGIAPGAARRSLLLSPTGRIRADVAVIGIAEGLALVQGPGQPDPIDRLLDPFVLSSDVRLARADRTLICAPGPGPSAPPAGHGVDVARPSILGGGFDLLTVRGASEHRAVEALRSARTPVGEAAVRAWEIRRGIPRFPDDFGRDALPAEGNLGAPIIDEAKGCFLGQESVARVRNLGHPPHVILPLWADGGVVIGDVVLAGDAESGTVTAATPLPGRGIAALARVRWSARGGPLVTRSGVVLVPR